LLHGEVVNRKWMVAAAIAAILAIVGGAYVGRNLLFDDSVTRTPASEKPRRPAVVVFHETVSDVSLRYPGNWTRRRSTEDNVPLVAVAPDGETSLLVRVQVTGLDDVTSKTLPIVRKYTDPLVEADKTVKLLGPPQAVTVGGLLGYRYRYTYRAGAGAHDHYFLFKRGRMIALVFQATPASRLDALEPQFERLARSFSGTGPS
jgi:hypothetical protein